MPFVTKIADLKLTHDVTKVNGFRPLRLAYGLSYDFNVYGKAHKEYIWRGQPDKGMHWVELPVFRIPTNRFGPEEWDRFFQYYEMNQDQISVQVYYEPHIEDVIVPGYTSDFKRHFPLWVLEALVARGEYEVGVKRNKLLMPVEEKMLTQEEYEGIMLSIKERQELEKKGDIKDPDEEEYEIIAHNRRKRRASDTMQKGRAKQRKDNRDAEASVILDAHKEDLSKVAEKKLKESEVTTGGNVS